MEVIEIRFINKIHSCIFFFSKDEQNCHGRLLLSSSVIIVSTSLRKHYISAFSSETPPTSLARSVNGNFFHLVIKVDASEGSNICHGIKSYTRREQQNLLQEKNVVANAAVEVRCFQESAFHYTKELESLRRWATERLRDMVKFSCSYPETPLN